MTCTAPDTGRHMTLAAGTAIVSECRYTLLLAEGVKMALKVVAIECGSTALVGTMAVPEYHRTVFGVAVALIFLVSGAAERVAPGYHGTGEDGM